MRVCDLINLMIVRRMEPARDLDGFLRVVHAVDPYPRTPAEWWDRNRRAAPDAFRRYLVGEVDGEIVAIGAMLDNEVVAGGVVARLVVDPAHRGGGHGRAMAEALEALVVERAPAMIDVRLRDDDGASRAWAERRGFRVHTPT